MPWAAAAPCHWPPTPAGMKPANSPCAHAWVTPDSATRRGRRHLTPRNGRRRRSPQPSHCTTTQATSRGRLAGRPLSPMLALVTRPEPQASTWAQALRDAGLQAQALPLIGITPPADTAAVESIWMHLHQFRALMFVSPAAADWFFRLALARPMARRHPRDRTGPRNRQRAIGPWLNGRPDASANHLARRRRPHRLRNPMAPAGPLIGAASASASSVAATGKTHEAAPG